MPKPQWVQECADLYVEACTGVYTHPTPTMYVIPNATVPPPGIVGAVPGDYVCTKWNNQYYIINADMMLYELGSADIPQPGTYNLKLHL